MPRTKQPSQWAKGATQIAAAIKAKFGIECHRQSIVDWKKLWPPFPASDDAGRYHLETCFAWIAEHKAPKPLTQAEADIYERAKRAEAETKITKAATAKFELEELNKTYIRRDVARHTVCGAVKKYHNLVRSIIESDSTMSRREKLQQIGVTPEQVAIFYEFDLAQSRAVIDKIERECERESK